MRANKGNGKCGTRWLMYSRGSESIWVTQGFYSLAEVEAWKCSRPIIAVDDQCEGGISTKDNK